MDLFPYIFHALFPAARALPPLSAYNFILKAKFCGHKQRSVEEQEEMRGAGEIKLLVQRS